MLEGEGTVRVPVVSFPEKIDPHAVILGDVVPGSQVPGPYILVFVPEELTELEERVLAAQLDVELLAELLGVGEADGPEGLLVRFPELSRHREARSDLGPAYRRRHVGAPELVVER